MAKLKKYKFRWQELLDDLSDRVQDTLEVMCLAGLVWFVIALMITVVGTLTSLFEHGGSFNPFGYTPLFLDWVWAGGIYGGLVALVLFIIISYSDDVRTT